MWIILTPEIAQHVSGDYGDCNSLMPTLLRDGNYALHITVFDYDPYKSVFGILRQCPIVESIELLEVINEPV